MESRIEEFWRDGDPSVVVGGKTYRDYLAAFDRAMAWSNPNPDWTNDDRGLTVTFGPWDYWFSETAVLRREVRLAGSGAQSTRLRFLDKFTGIESQGFGTTPIPGRSDNSVIENLHILAEGVSNPDAHGILMISALELHHVSISGFGGDGVHIRATLALGVDDRHRGSASGWFAINCNISNCGGSGIFVTPSGDANMGTAIRVLANNNGAWGVRDECSYGSVYIGCLADNNRSGPYCSHGGTNTSVFLHCHAEEGQRPSRIAAPAFVIGGVVDVAPDLKPIHFSAENATACFPNGAHAYGNKAISGDGTTRQAEVYFGDSGAVSPDSTTALSLNMRKDGAFDSTVNTYRFNYNVVTSTPPQPNEGWWELKAAGTLAALRVSTNQSAVGENQIWLENGAYFGNGEQNAAIGRVLVRTSNGPPSGAPGAGLRWKVGDHLLNSEPVPGDPTKGFAGWVCTAEGNPGTWSPYGRL